MNDVRVRCTTVKQACDTVLHAKGFAWAMRKLLAMGNYINGGGSKGQAWGFKMDTLASTLGTRAACWLLAAGCCREVEGCGGLSHTGVVDGCWLTQSAVPTRRT